MKRFRLNKRGLDQLATRNQTGAAMEKIAQEIARRAESGGGRFTEGYRTKRLTVDGTAGARAGTDHPFAHWDEWGNINRAPRAPLRRALSSMGLLSQTKQKGKP